MCYYFVYLKMAIQFFKLLCCVTIIGISHASVFAQSIKNKWMNKIDKLINKKINVSF